MKAVPVSELRLRLTHYLRLVRSGTEVQILKRGVPIARLIGLHPVPRRDADRIERLEKAGVLRRGRGNLAWVISQPPIAMAAGVDLAAALDADRDDL